MSKQKYFYKLYITCQSKLDNTYHDIFYGNYKNMPDTERKAKIFINNEKVKNINIFCEKTGKIIILKGISLWDLS
jgi:hypothetical protein